MRSALGCPTGAPAALANLAALAPLADAAPPGASPPRTAAARTSAPGAAAAAASGRTSGPAAAPASASGPYQAPLPQVLPPDIFVAASGPAVLAQNPSPAPRAHAPMALAADALPAAASPPAAPLATQQQAGPREALVVARSEAQLLEKVESASGAGAGPGAVAPTQVDLPATQPENLDPGSNPSSRPAARGAHPSPGRHHSRAAVSAAPPAGLDPGGCQTLMSVARMGAPEWVRHWCLLNCVIKALVAVHKCAPCAFWTMNVDGGGQQGCSALPGRYFCKCKRVQACPVVLNMRLFAEQAPDERKGVASMIDTAVGINS